MARTCYDNIVAQEMSVLEWCLSADLLLSRVNTVPVNHMTCVILGLPLAAQGTWNPSQMLLL